MSKMSKQDLLQHIATILTALLECDGYWSPKSPFYLVFGCDLPKYQQIEQLMVESGMITVTSEIMALTPKGLVLAKQTKEALEKLKKGVN